MLRCSIWRRRRALLITAMVACPAKVCSSSISGVGVPAAQHGRAPGTRPTHHSESAESLCGLGAAGPWYGGNRGTGRPAGSPQSGTWITRRGGRRPEPQNDFSSRAGIEQGAGHQVLIRGDGAAGHREGPRGTRGALSAESAGVGRRCGGRGLVVEAGGADGVEGSVIGVWRSSDVVEVVEQLGVGDGDRGLGGERLVPRRP